MTARPRPPVLRLGGVEALALEVPDDDVAGRGVVHDQHVIQHSQRGETAGRHLRRRPDASRVASGS
jgi:hypothetical protein